MTTFKIIAQLLLLNYNPFLLQEKNHRNLINPFEQVQNMRLTLYID